jgi:thiol-disulfide isomerase/thioredoxin
MKYLILFLTIFAVCVAPIVHAQTNAGKFKYAMDSTSVVKDSTGRVLAYSEWAPIVGSGEYNLRFQTIAGKTEFTLFPFSVQQKEAVLATMPKPRASKSFKTGEKISSFTADDINGNSFKLKKLQGKIVVLNFWFLGCPPCRLEMPELNKIALSYANNPDVVFISFALDERYEIKNYLKINPLAYHIIDNAMMYANLYHVNLYPTNLVLDKEGKVRFHSSGYSPNLPYWLKKTIEECKQETSVFDAHQ